MKEINKKRYKQIGGLIKKLREKEDLSQQELAKKMSFQSGTAISLIESGNRKISISDLEKIAKFFKVNINYFLGEKVEIDLNTALRADEDLNKGDRDKIIDFYSWLKNKNK